MGAVKITSGRLRGRLVETPAGNATRPLLTRVRKSLVDILRPKLPTASVLDLFAGSGAITFELLSNGASRAVAVEIDPTTAGLVRKNAEALGLEVEVLESDAGDAVRRLAKRGEVFTIVVVAPPYGLGLQKKTLVTLDENSIVAPLGLVVVQREARDPAVDSAGSLRIRRTRVYGRTALDFYERDSP